MMHSLLKFLGAVPSRDLEPGLAEWIRLSALRPAPQRLSICLRAAPVSALTQSADFISDLAYHNVAFRTLSIRCAIFQRALRPSGATARTETEYMPQRSPHSRFWNFRSALT